IGELLTAASYQVHSVANGREALEFLQHDRPDIVVTDLEMPEIDGLSLVRDIQMRNLRVPIVLMTAHGSEQTAVAALRAGATSYVPKSQIRELLLDTVGELLTISLDQGSYERLLDCATRSEFEFELDNDPELIPPLCDLLQQMIQSICEMPQGERLRVGVALEQALHNAMFRGNLEVPGALPLPPPGTPGRMRPFDERRVLVIASIDPEEVRLLVRDEGPGFDVAEARRRLAEGALTAGSARGLVLMQAFMDDVAFNARGNEVILTKRVPRRPARPPLIRARAPQTDGAAARGTATMAATHLRVFGRLTWLETNETFPLGSRRIVVGRDRSCDVRI